MQTSQQQSRWHALAIRLAYKLERYHVGAENAVGAPELMEYLELTNDRDLRSVKKYALEELRVPIASTFNDGYCIPASYEDDAYDHSVRQKKKSGVSIIQSANALEDAMVARYGPPRLFEVG